MALETPSWLNHDFTERILRLSESDNSVEVTDVVIKPATAKGDNYTSDMMRVFIEFTRKREDSKVHEKKTLIFKFEPIVEGNRQDLIQKTQIFDTEILMMTDTLKKMSDLLGHENRLGAQVYHVRMERPLCLIMEDLANLGFRMADRQAGLDLTHSMMAIQRLAMFHGSSVALVEKEPEQKTKYVKGMFNQSYPDEMAIFFIKGCESLAYEVDKWPELGKRYGDKLRNIAPKLYKTGVKVVKPRDDEFNVINHGDCWVNNMLFKYDENTKKPVQHIFVDFQLCIYTSPAIDLQYFLSTSPSVQVYENHMETLLEEYVNTLKSTMEKLGCKTKPPTLDAIKKTIKDRAFYQLISSITVLPIILIDKSEAQDIDEILQHNGEYNNLAYKGPIYRKIMAKRLPKFEEMGLLDI